MSKDHMNQFIFKDMTDNTKLCKNARDRNRASFSGCVALKNAVVSRVLIDGFWFCLRFLFDHNCFYHMSKGHIDQWILGDMTGNTKLPKSFSGRDRASFTVSIALKNAVITRVLIDGFQFCLRFLIFHSYLFHLSKGHNDEWISGDMTGNTKL